MPIGLAYKTLLSSKREMGAGPENITRVILDLADQEILSASGQVAVSWDTEVFDAPGAWNSGSPTVITVPSGYSYAKAKVYIPWLDNPSYEVMRTIFLYLNSTEIINNFVFARLYNGQFTSTGWIAVSPADTLHVKVSAGDNDHVVGSSYEACAYFEVEFSA